MEKLELLERIAVALEQSNVLKVREIEILETRRTPTKASDQVRKERALVTMYQGDIRSVGKLAELTNIPARTLYRWDEVRKFCRLSGPAEIDRRATDGEFYG